MKDHRNKPMRQRISGTVCTWLRCAFYGEQLIPEVIFVTPLLMIKGGTEMVRADPERVD